MDPLSIITSAITLAGVLGTSLEQVRRFFRAEADIFSLTNEVSDLHPILEEVGCTIRERGQDISLKGDQARAIASIVKGARTELEELQHIIDNRIFTQDSTTGKQYLRLVRGSTGPRDFSIPPPTAANRACCII